MKLRSIGVLFEWSAGLVIGLVPILCHSLVAFVGKRTAEIPEAWAVDLLFVAITTSGLCALTLFTRLAKGVVTFDHLKPHSLLLMAFNMLAFLLSGVLFGQISAGAARDLGLSLPIIFLILATGSSLYFEFLLALEVSQGTGE